MTRHKPRNIRAARHAERLRRKAVKAAMKRNPSKRQKQRQKRRAYELSQKMAASKLEALMRVKSANLPRAAIATSTPPLLQVLKRWKSEPVEQRVVSFPVFQSSKKGKAG